jgi:predicted membrane-bound spermidine synthase
MNESSNGSRFWLALPALFLLSYAVLTFEVALTRIFSVMLSYHFVFAIISAALLGLGVGAMVLKRWLTALPRSAVRMSAVIFALLVAVSVLAIILLPLANRAGFWLYLVLAVLPFCAAGFAVSGLFQEFADRGPLLYGADLIGAAIGALTVVPLLDAFGSVNAVFFAAAAASAGALLLGFSRVRLPVFAGAAFLAISASFSLLTGFGVQISVPVTNDPNKDMYQMLANPAFKAKIIESRWSSFGRTDVVKSELTPYELTLFVDGAAGSAMYDSAKVMGNQHEVEHLTLHFGEYFPFLFLKDDEKKDALIIGPGGGRDVVVALLGGVKSITAVEVNPDIVQIVKDYRDFNGAIYSGDPRVTAIIAEGRNYVRTTERRYDLIMLAIPVTKSSRSVEGYALTENYLFTVEAFKDYLDHLSPNGRIIIVTHGDAEIYRIISLATEAFAAKGLSEQQAMQHLYTVASDMMPAIVIQNQALTIEEADTVHRGLHKLGFDKGAFYVPFQEQVVTPGARLGIDKELRMFDRFLVDVAEGKLSLSTLARSASLDFSPVTDNRPFFYKFERGLPRPFGTFAFLLVLGFAVLGYLVLLRKKPGMSPATFTGALRERPALKLFLLLFTALGLGYMLIEIALFQKLMLFFGQPQMALTVLLFSLLLGGGLGSFASSLLRGGGNRVVAFISLGVAIGVGLLSLFFPSVFSSWLSPRVAAMALLIPLGFLMGFPFPFAIRLIDRHGMGDSVSVMWGANAVASVLGSALSMIVGISVGFSWALALGAVLYVLAAIAFLALPPAKERSA